MSKNKKNKIQEVNKSNGCYECPFETDMACEEDDRGIYLPGNRGDFARCFLLCRYSYIDNEDPIPHNCPLKDGSITVKFI